MPNSGYRSNSAAFAAGVRDAAGVPAAVLTASYVGFGAFANASGFSLSLMLASTAAIWALPGQLILVEMTHLDATGLAIVLAVWLSAARFLPMTIALWPLLRDRAHTTATQYAAAHLISMTSWAAAMSRCPDLPVAQRLPYFAGFALTCWRLSIAAGAVGYSAADWLPLLLRLGLVFLTPVYFLLILIGAVRTRMGRIALACGAIGGPLAHLVVPQWSVLVAGLVGGTAAYLIHRHGAGRD